MFAENLMCPIATHQWINFVAVVCGIVLMYIGVKIQPKQKWFKWFIIGFGIGLFLIDGYYLGTWVFG